jgi:hypothetical protein
MSLHPRHHTQITAPREDAIDWRGEPLPSPAACILGAPDLPTAMREALADIAVYREMVGVLTARVHRLTTRLERSSAALAAAHGENRCLRRREAA